MCVNQQVLFAGHRTSRAFKYIAAVRALSRRSTTHGAPHAALVPPTRRNPEEDELDLYLNQPEAEEELDGVDLQTKRYLHL